jgi:hypothetical protein
MKILVAETQPTVPIGTFGPPLIEAGAELVYWRTPDEAPPASLDGFAGVVALVAPLTRIKTPSTPGSTRNAAFGRHQLEPADPRPCEGAGLAAKNLREQLGAETQSNRRQAALDCRLSRGWLVTPHRPHSERAAQLRGPRNLRSAKE